MYFLNYFRKTDIAKNVVLCLEFASFPYGASAVHRSSVVSLDFFERQAQVVVFLDFLERQALDTSFEIILEGLPQNQKRKRKQTLQMENNEEEEEG